MTDDRFDQGEDLEPVIRLNGQEIDPDSELGRQILEILKGGGLEGAELTEDQRRVLGSAGRLEIDKRPRRGKGAALSALERRGFGSIPPRPPGAELLGDDSWRRVWNRAQRRATLRELAGPSPVLHAAMKIDTEEAP